jgi:hypothetical protein
MPLLASMQMDVSRLFRQARAAIARIGPPAGVIAVPPEMG